MDKTDKIISVLRTVFENFEPSSFSPQMSLGDLPGWDSMASVNLQLELESSFGVDLSAIELAEGYSIADVMNILRDRGADMAMER